MSKRRRTGPMIPDLHDHALFVNVLSKLDRNQVEYFFFRLVGDRTTAIILRELAYWLDQADKDPGYPRAKPFRDGFYWVARTKQELLDAHGIKRKDVERAYAQTKDFVETKSMRWGVDRVTHWRFNFPRLLERFHADPIVRKLIDLDSMEEVAVQPATASVPASPSSTSECTATPLNAGIAECPDSTVEADIPQCAGVTEEAAHSHNQSSSQRKQTHPPTGSAGPADAGTGSTSPSAPSGANAPEPPPQRTDYIKNGTLHPARVLDLLESVRGKPMAEKRKQVLNVAARAQQAISYLMVWQRIFEIEHPKRRCPFTAQDVERAWTLADEQVELKRFHEVLVEAHEVEGPDKGKNPVYMAQYHSHEFGSFCKHFTRIEGELVRANLLEDA